MKVLNELPKNLPEGTQFVCYWEYNNQLWCETYKFENKLIYIYNNQEDEFEVYCCIVEFSNLMDKKKNIQFILQEKSLES